MDKEKMIALDKFIKEIKDARELTRALAVKMYCHGALQKEIMKHLSVSQAFVSKWCKIFNDFGAESLKLQHKGSAGKMEKKDRHETVDWIKAQNHLTTKQLKEHIKNKYGLTYNSVQSYCNLLAEAEYRHKKSQKINPMRDEIKVKEKLKDIKKLAKKVKSEVASKKRKIFF